MSLFRLTIVSSSDYDYTLDFPIINRSNFQINKNEDELSIILDFYNCKPLEFIQNMITFFEKFKIDTNKNDLKTAFEIQKKQLLSNLKNNIIESPNNWFSGNQELMITFFEITEKEIKFYEIKN